MFIYVVLIVLFVFFIKDFIEDQTELKRRKKLINELKSGIITIEEYQKKK